MFRSLYLKNFFSYECIKVDVERHPRQERCIEFFEVIQKRRSIRRFHERPFPDESIQKALESAILAPNSSNVQTWDFHWIRHLEVRAQVISACLNQSAARTASHLIVVTANPKNWRRSQRPLVEWVQKVNAPHKVILYYKKLVPFLYSWGFLNSLAPLKWIGAFFYGIFRPIARGPFTKSEIQGVCIKSAALAAENFVLAITALGGASCMMEGFDEWRLLRILKKSAQSSQLSPIERSTRIVMVIGVGFESDRGDGKWGPQFRLPLKDVLHIH